MNYNYDDTPQSVNIQVRLDANHPPDPLGIYDVITVTIALSAIFSFIITDGLICCLKDRSRTIRSKNVFMIVLTSLTSIIHISAVVSNYILMTPQKEVPMIVGANLTMPEMDNMSPLFDLTEIKNCNSTTWSSMVFNIHEDLYVDFEVDTVGLINNSHNTQIFDPSPFVNILGSANVCVIVYFWWEYFFGLGFYIAFSILRMRIILISQSDVKEALTHLRRKNSVRPAFVFLILLPLYMLNLCITVNGLSQWTIYPIDFSALFPTQTQSDLVNVARVGTAAALNFFFNLKQSILNPFSGADLNTEENYMIYKVTEDPNNHVVVREVLDQKDQNMYVAYMQYCFTYTSAVCETPFLVKFVLILILLGYLGYIFRLSLRLSSYSLNFGYAATALHSAYVSLVVLVVCGVLNFIHALTYWWGRCLFVILVIFMHVFDYYHLIGGSLLKCLIRGTCCLSDNFEDDENFEQYKTLGKIIQAAERTSSTSGIDDIYLSDHTAIRQLHKAFNEDTVYLQYNPSTQNQPKVNNINSASRQVYLALMTSRHISDFSYLDDCGYIRKLFYEYCEDTGLNLVYREGVLILDKTLKNPTRETADVTKIIGCIEMFNALNNFIEKTYNNHVNERALHMTNTTPQLLLSGVDFTCFTTDEKYTVSSLASSILLAYSPNSKNVGSFVLQTNDKLYTAFKHFNSVLNFKVWDSDAPKNIAHQLKMVLFNEFFANFLQDKKFDLIEERQKRAADLALTTIISMLDNEILSIEDYEKVLDAIESEEAFTEVAKSVKPYKEAFQSTSTYRKYEFGESDVESNNFLHATTPEHKTNFVANVYNYLEEKTDQENESFDDFEEMAGTESEDIVMGFGENVSSQGKHHPKPTKFENGKPQRLQAPSILRTMMQGPEVVDEIALAMSEGGCTTMDVSRGINQGDIMGYSLHLYVQTQERQQKFLEEKAQKRQRREELFEGGDIEMTVINEDLSNSEVIEPHDFKGEHVFWNVEYDEDGNVIEDKCTCACACSWLGWILRKLILYCDAVEVPYENSEFSRLTHDQKIDCMLEKYYGKKVEKEIKIVNMEEVVTYKGIDAETLTCLKAHVDAMEKKDKELEKQCRYFEPVRLPNGSVVYGSPTTAFLNFLYHLYLWMVMPIDLWKSSQSVYFFLCRYRWGRFILNSGLAPRCFSSIRRRHEEYVDSFSL